MAAASPSATGYPYNIPVSFQFDVKIAGVTGVGECLFQDVSGLNVKMAPEVINEGGTNDQVYKLPTRVTYDNLVLKRGLLKGSSLITWVNNALRNFTFVPKQVTIALLDENSAPVITWTLANAYPVSLQISELKAMDNGLVIETLELAYSYYDRTG